MKTWRAWWKYPELVPRADKRDDSDEPNSDSAALCFSGGVDSFYSLLSLQPKPEFLIAIHGFDIPLRDEVRMSALKESLGHAAAHVGAKPIVIRTNFREHPGAGRAGLWERAHGGALAAVGHLLCAAAGRLIISSTYSVNRQRPWGSSFMTDHLWSSDRLEVLHYGADLGREEKLRFLAREPLARRHLRVCWENRAPCGNCSRCAKCVVTMLMLAECDELGAFPAFTSGASLAETIDALPYIKANLNKLDSMVRRGQLKPELAEAARKLVKRSRRMKLVWTSADLLRRAFA